LSIDAKSRTAVPVPFSASTFVIAAVSVVFRGRLTDRADVEMRLVALELLLGHSLPPFFLGLGVDDFAAQSTAVILVPIELHRERGPPLRRRAQVGAWWR